MTDEVKFYCEGWPVTVASAALMGIADRFPDATVRNEDGYYAVVLGERFIEPDYAYEGERVRIEDTVEEVTVEDNGMAKIAEVGTAGEFGMFVRIQSWGDHTEFDRVIETGGRYRVTIERIDDDTDPATEDP